MQVVYVEEIYEIGYLLKLRKTIGLVVGKFCTQIPSVIFCVLKLKSGPMFPTPQFYFAILNYILGHYPRIFFFSNE